MKNVIYYEIEQMFPFQFLFDLHPKFQMRISQKLLNRKNHYIEWCHKQQSLSIKNIKINLKGTFTCSLINESSLIFANSSKKNENPQKS